MRIGFSERRPTANALIGPTCITESMPLPGSQIGCDASQGGHSDPSDTVVPESSLTLQLKRLSAKVNQAYGASHWHTSAGDMAPEGLTVCQNSCFPTNFSILTLPQIESASSFDMAVAQPDFFNTLAAFCSDYATFGLFDDNVNPPRLVASKQTAHSLGRSLVSLPVFSPPERPYQDLALPAASINEFTEPLLDLELSCHSFNPQPQEDVSAPRLHYQFSLDAAPSNNLGLLYPSDTGFFLTEVQTQNRDSISPTVNNSLHAPNLFKCT